MPIYTGGWGTVMTQYLFMCRSLTYAQKSARLLERSGITAAVVKAPQGLTKNGCGYAVSLYRSFDAALELLRASGLISGRIFQRLDGGEYREFVR